jgi:hypothetical protein
MREKSLWIVFLVLLLVGCRLTGPEEQGQPTTVVPTRTPVEEVQPPVDKESAAVARAISDLQERQGIGKDEIMVDEVISTEFPDASLGVPEPGMSYAQVITPGYVIRLRAHGETYEYRVSSERVALVPEAQDPAMPTLPGQVTFERVEIAGTGLSIEVPAGWLRLDPDWVWVPAEGSSLRLGVDWTPLPPPMEAEAALLPSPSQVLDSEPVTLSWGQGRRVVLEVYGPAEQGGDAKAPVESVEMHVLVVVSQEGARRGYDLYARGATADELASLEPLLAHVLDTSTLEAAP